MSDKSSAKRFTPDTLLKVRRLGSFDVSPDGRWLVATIDELSADGKTYETNLHRLDLSSAGGPLVPLTDDRLGKSHARFLPDGRLAFLQAPDPSARTKAPSTPEGAEPGKPASAAAKAPDDKDDKLQQLHVMRVDGGGAEQLTTLPGGACSFEFAADLSSVVIMAPLHPGAESLEQDRAIGAEWKERKASGRLFESYPVRFWDHWHGPRHPHLLVGDGLAQGLRDLTRGLGLGLEETSGEVSPDGRLACFDMRHVDRDLRFEQHLFLFDLASGERRQLTSGSAEHWGARWSPDGTSVACLTHAKGPRVTGKRDIAIVDVATGSTRIVTGALDLWPERPEWADARTLVFSTDERGHHVIKAVDVETGAARSLTTEGHASELRLSADRRTVYYLLDRLESPADAWCVDLAGGEPRRLTRVNEDVLAGMTLPSGIAVDYPASEGRTGHLWEVRPPDFDASKRYPLLVWIHGGPIHAYLDQFHFRWNAQAYASQGYVVIMVNPRGSTGFGQQWIEDNNGDWGNRCYQDVMLAVDAYQSRPYIDGARMAALGASFGGYMVNWLAGRETRFRCMVSHAGLFDLTAFHGTTDCGPEWELEFGGVPWDHPEIYTQWSPHAHVGKFQTPTLVTHGELDYRVPLGEGLQMFQALQKMGVPSQFLYFPDENHWILKPANMKLWNETVLGWLSRWLG